MIAQKESSNIELSDRNSKKVLWNTSIWEFDVYGVAGML